MIARFGSLHCALAALVVWPLVALASPAALALDASDPYLPGDRYRINFPYLHVDPVPVSALSGLTYALGTCRQTQLVLSLTQGALAIHAPDRSITVSVPARLDLANPAVANGVVWAAWTTAWRACLARTRNRRTIQPEFAGVRVIVLQNDRFAMELDRTQVSYTGAISARLLRNVPLEQKIEADRLAAERQRQLAAAEAERQQQLEQARRAESWRSFWAKLRFAFYAILTAIGAYILFRIGPIVLGYLRYFLNPHPARALIHAATRRHRSVPMSGPALATAMAYVPSGQVEAELAAKDVRNLAEKMKRETEFLHESEKLARLAIEMEQQRARVDELRKRGGMA